VLAEVSRLATKAELRDEVSRLATKAELRDEVSRLATKAELQEGLQSVKDELRAELASKADLRAESVETRRHMTVLVEDLRDEIRILAEGLEVLDARDARQHAESMNADARLDSRVMALEASRRRPRAR